MLALMFKGGLMKKITNLILVCIITFYANANSTIDIMLKHLSVLYLRQMEGFQFRPKKRLPAIHMKKSFHLVII
jgi:hypothetical protein